MEIERFEDYFINTVLPVWASTAFDETAGQFMEGLQLDGAPDPSGIVRTRTAARQIYVFAQAAVLGVAPQGALDKAETAFANLRKVAWVDGPAPGYARALHYPTAKITDPERDLYDHACVLLALAWLSKAAGKARYQSYIDEIIAAMDLTLAAPAGGWAEDGAGRLPRRQNPHMHYLEACLALWETGHGEAYAARAGQLLVLFQTRFFDEETGALREFFGPGWETEEAYGSHRLEPGHMAEWVWLLRRYTILSGNDQSTAGARLLEAAVRIGRSGETSFLVDEVLISGEPSKASRRLWPQAELLKALVVEGHAQDRADYRTDAERMIAALFETYLAETPAGTWRDCFDGDGQPIATSIPASSLYHLWTVIPELLRLKST
ncbi:AGE family epimerase/isomerase [Pararhizobium sp.]|uniref:AGE family epimerase/isomerase n=1 Tax=Pararhizobium sp. TaxID=1977563 RepID=UPI00271B08AC|nr:AGE family epimerase/isomerase [Pararhizobium sp.]MDO9417817.1 AGE family epimerase/isomerase [Pararhizobium sp.]